MASDSPPRMTRPTTRVRTGWPTTRAAICPHAPRFTCPATGMRGQKTARPKMARRAGSRVRLANRAMPIPMASAGPNPWYSPKVAMTTVQSAAITVRPEKVIDSPTLASENATASWGANPFRISSRTRKMRKSP